MGLPIAPVFEGVAPVHEYTLPEPVKDTPEVAAAKAEFQAAFEEAASREKRSTPAATAVLPAAVPAALPYAGFGYAGLAGLEISPSCHCCPPSCCPSCSPIRWIRIRRSCWTRIRWIPICCWIPIRRWIRICWIPIRYRHLCCCPSCCRYLCCCPSCCRSCRCPSCCCSICPSCPQGCQDRHQEQPRIR